MIRHHNPFSQLVSLIVKVIQGVDNKFTKVGTTQDAFAMTVVEPALKPRGETVEVFAFRFQGMRCGMSRQPQRSLDDPCFKFFQRNAVGGPKRHELGRAKLAEMRQVTFKVFDRRGWVEIANLDRIGIGRNHDSPQRK